MKRLAQCLFVCGILIATENASHAFPVALGGFSFESTQFGNTLVESDGGTHSSGNWLNIANADPGNPAYLTGANFDTGIANIGIGGAVAYTIGYTTGITNVAGVDLGIVVARFSTDSFTVELSTDGGTTFTPSSVIAAATGVSSGVGKSYFYGGGGPFSSTLFVHSLDFSSFGLAGGAIVNAIRISNPPSTELDLIRAAGFAQQQTEVPEPASMVLFGLTALGMGVVVRRRRTANRQSTQAA
ncbi:MAG: PEP-CTERM sorting domain-containing protein [Planctomycetaceae bacterium]